MMPSTMQFVAHLAGGDASSLHLTAGQVPVPGAGELLLRVQASGVNRPDILQRKGLYPPPAGANPVLGLEAAGTVVGGDPAELAAAGLASGDAVCALVTGGGYAAYCVAPIAQCLPIPAGLTPVQAASLPEVWFTVWSNLIDRAGLCPGETLLVHGGSSGIGVTAIQLARALGVRVIVTAGSPAKCEACLALGADAAIDYKQSDFVAETLRLTDGQGVDVVLDMVAGPYVARNLQVLREDGRAVIIAVQGGTQANLDVGLIQRRRLTLTGSTLRVRSVAFKARIAQALRATVWPWLASGHVRPVIAACVDAAQAAQAHRLMESGTHIGKIVLTWSEA